MRAFSLKDVNEREKEREGRQLPDQTKPEPTPPGHNSNFETDMLIFAGQVAKIEAEIDVLADKKTELRQTIKNAGYELAVFDMIRKKVDQEPETIEAWFGNIARYGRAFSLPMGQLELFDGPRSPLNEVTAAEDDGFRRALTGKPIDTERYHENSELGQSHIAGFNRGQAVLKERFLAHNAANSKVEEAEKAKKSRKEIAAKNKAAKKDDAAKAKALKDAKAAERKAKKKKADKPAPEKAQEAVH